MLTLSYTTVSDCCTFAPKIYVSFPRIPFPETTEIPNEACLTLAKRFPFQSAFAFFLVDDATDSNLSSVCKRNFLPLPPQVLVDPGFGENVRVTCPVPSIAPVRQLQPPPSPRRAEGRWVLPPAVHRAIDAPHGQEQLGYGPGT